MQIKPYNRRLLQEFVDSDFYKNLKQIPISYHRAVSHIQNPDVQDNDELLWAAYENGQLVGYVGVLPNYIVENQERKKVCWLSCFWVEENFRKGNVTSMLFFPLIKRYGKQLIVSNFLPNLEKTYQNLGIFQSTLYKDYSQFYCKSCTGDILPTRFPKIRFLKPILRFCDGVFNVFLLFRKMFIKFLQIHSQIVSDANFDSEFQDFLLSFYKEKDYVVRLSEHFDWILNYPWVLQGKPDDESKRYYFSSKAKQFCYDSVKFYKNNELKAYLLLKIRDRKLTVSYFFAADEMLDDVVSYILQKVKKEKLILVTTSDKRVTNKIRSHRIQFIFERLNKRAYILPKTLELTPEMFQEGDGDNVFT